MVVASAVQLTRAPAYRAHAAITPAAAAAALPRPPHGTHQCRELHTLTFRSLDVLFFIGHGRREVLHFRVTAHPTAAWVWQHLRTATPWGRSPPYLLRARDRVYGGDFGATLKRLGIERVLTPVRASRANAVAERLVGTLRRECLDHVLIVNERHLHALLVEFTTYYNQQRPHRTVRMESPVPTARAPTGPIRSRPALGGLHHRYDRVACSRLAFCRPTGGLALRTSSR